MNSQNLSLSIAIATAVVGATAIRFRSYLLVAPVAKAYS